VTSDYRSPQPEPPTAVCDGCNARVLLKECSFDDSGRTLCRPCKGAHDFKGAQEKSRGKGLKIPYRVIGISIAMIALLPLALLRARGRMGVVAIAYAVVAVIVVIDVVVARRKSG
jgi:hypothetical protein